QQHGDHAGRRALRGAGRRSSTRRASGIGRAGAGLGLHVQKKRGRHGGSWRGESRELVDVPRAVNRRGKPFKSQPKWATARASTERSTSSSSVSQFETEIRIAASPRQTV